MSKDIQYFKDIIGKYFMMLPAVKSHYQFTINQTFDKRFPPASIEGILVYVFAYGAWVMNSLFELFKIDVDNKISELKPHTLQWYVAKAKCYQHKESLPTLSGQIISDVYNNIYPDKQIVKYAVAQEVPVVRDGVEIGSVVSMKVAKYTSKSNATPTKLGPEELLGLRYYFSQIKDAGVPISIVSNDPDKMNATISIFYNPIILEPSADNGYLIDSNSRDVVRDAVLAIIEGLPFNGVLKKTDITDAIKAIQGIEVVDITALSVCPAVDGAEFKPVTGYCVPLAGYFAINQLSLNLNPYVNGN